MSRKRFCAECGDTESALHNNFCKSCYWKLNSLSSLKKTKIDLPYCLNCGSVKLNSGWTGSNTHEEIPENYCIFMFQQYHHKTYIYNHD